MSDSRPAKVGKEFAKENAREASLEQSVIGPELKLEPVPTISFNFYEKSTAEKRGTQEKQQESITEAKRTSEAREQQESSINTHKQESTRKQNRASAAREQQAARTSAAREQQAPRRRRPPGFFKCLSVASCLSRKPSKRKAQRNARWEGEARVGARAKRINLIMVRSTRPGERRPKRVLCRCWGWGENRSIVKLYSCFFARARGLLRCISFFIN
jgi:hypothetical protein